MFTNNFENLNNTFQGILVTDLSDQYPIFHTNFAIKQRIEEKYFMKRTYSTRNKQAFLHSLQQVNWLDVFSVTDTQTAFSTFHGKYIELYNRHFPKIRAKLRYNNRKPWLSEGIRISIKKKNKLYLKYHRTKTAANEVAYKYYRNKLNNVLKIAERKHYADIIEQNKSNLRKTWAIMKELINKNKVTVPQSKFKLSNGSYKTDKKTFSENFNNFFISVGQTLARKIPHQ